MLLVDLINLHYKHYLLLDVHIYFMVTLTKQIISLSAYVFFHLQNQLLTSGSKCGASGNWSFYGNACYYVSDGQGDSGRSWRQAREFCRQSGGDLASVLSNQEQLFMYLTLVCILRL